MAQWLWSQTAYCTQLMSAEDSQYRYHGVNSMRTIIVGFLESQLTVFKWEQKGNYTWMCSFGLMAAIRLFWWRYFKKRAYASEGAMRVKELQSSTTQSVELIELIGNLSIDDELDDDDISCPWETGEKVSLSAGKLKVKQPFLKKTTKLSVPAIFNEHFLPLCGLMAFRDVRNFLLISLADDIIDDEEFIVLYDLYCSRDPDFPYDHNTAFDLDALV